MSEVKEPAFNIIILIVIMALLDGAFKVDFRSVEDVLSKRVRAPRHSLQLKFREEKLNVPIYRQPISIAHGIRTHGIKPLKYHTYLYYL